MDPLGCRRSSRRPEMDAIINQKNSANHCPEHVKKIVEIAAVLSNVLKAGRMVFFVFIVLRPAIAGDSASLFFSELFLLLLSKENERGKTCCIRKQSKRAKNKHKKPDDFQPS